MSRVQLDMSEEALLFLNELKEKTESSSRAEVVRNAIIYYDILVDHILKRDEIYVHTTDGAETKLTLPLMVRR